MRTIKLSFMAALAATALAGCTVKDVDTPQLAGPSSLARTIVMTADRDTLVQDGVQEAAIRVTAQVQPGQSENVRLRAQVYVDGVAQDFGTLSNKSPITPTTIFYRAPASGTTAGSQVPSTVTIAVTPDDSGDFRGEVTRTVDLRLIPPGVILPVNPNLQADFTFSPAAPLVMTVVNFDATPSTNGGTQCRTLCTYAWSFGDGTTAAGQQTTHQFRTAGNFAVSLTVTDGRGASTTTVKSVTVGPGAPPTAAFTTSPSTPSENQDIFFNASESTAATGRTLTKYEWSFGDGDTGSGMVTAHRYSAPGNYSVQLAVTDDAGTVDREVRSLQVGVTATGPNPSAALAVSPTSPKPGATTSFNASASRPGSGANIVSYTFNYGDGSPEEVVTNPLQTHVYVAAGTFTATVTVRDSLGRNASAQATVIVTP
jgi:PKD repeat protein